jgi:hypothetical protein
MNNTIDHISLLAVAVAALAVMILGWVWFAFIFERAYAVVLGRVDQPKTKMGALYIVGPSLCMLVTTLATAMLMAAQRVSSLGGAVGLGSIIGAGLLSATAMNMAINPNVPKPIIYGLLSSAYFFVASILISVVLYVIT